VLRAAEAGFSRVVLARELPLSGVREIARRTARAGIGLEVFAHGALCYSYSGQCLLSSVIGGRSGNRGMCAQPCRKPYALVTGDTDRYGRPGPLRELETPGRYLLSPRDLCTERHLPDLVRSPVVSLKIEGRMKSPEYVAIVVSTYRRALDAIAAGRGNIQPDAVQDLALAFSRGFTRGYLFGDRYETLMARDAPDNRGICIGTVIKQDRDGTVTIRREGTLVPETGDGLLFSAPAAGEEWGFLLNTAPVTRGRDLVLAVPRRVTAGSRVSVTSRRELEARARQIIARPPEDLVRRVPLDLRVCIDTGGAIHMEGRLAGGRGSEIRVPFHPDFRLVPSRTRPLTHDQLEAQLRKSGDTPFVIRKCSLEYTGSLFAPVGEINRLRREFLALAEEALLGSSVPPADAIVLARRRLAAAFAEPAPGTAAARNAAGGTAEPLSLTVYADSPEAVSGALGEGCARICFEPYFSLPRHSCGAGGEPRPVSEQAAEVMALCRSAGARFVLKLPKITRDYYLDAVLPDIALLQKDGLEECMAENSGTLHAIGSAVPGMALSGGAGLNIFNHRAACLMAHCRSLTLSPELSGAECRDLIRSARSRGCTASFALIVQGIADAMISEDCIPRLARQCRAGSGGGTGSPFFGIRDATGHVFPLVTDGECRTRIGNAVETCLIDHLPAIRDAGISGVVIDARGRPGAYAAEMTRIYTDAIRATGPGAPGEFRPAALKERVKAMAYGGITAGHFVRGLKE
jgi:putative protease